jgi:hypothetical protein
MEVDYKPQDIQKKKNSQNGILGDILAKAPSIEKPNELPSLHAHTPWQPNIKGIELVAPTLGAGWFHG